MVARTNAEDRGLNRQSSIRPWVVMKIYLANKDSNKHFPYTRLCVKSSAINLVSSCLKTANVLNAIFRQVFSIVLESFLF